MTTPIQISRRHLLGATAGLFAAASLKPTLASAQQAAGASKVLPEYVNWKVADGMIIHTPRTIETKRAAIGTSVITPSDRLFVRNNLPSPTTAQIGNVNDWKVSVEGVGKPKTFTLSDLKSMGFEVLATILQCSGNGRGFFATKLSGTQWETGAAGCVMWAGIPVRDLVKALGGVSAGMVYMTGTGGETLPAGIDPNTVIVERSVPLVAMQDSILAWEMNGEPLPIAHGGPLRLITPGYSGVNNIKYIKRLAFTAEQSPAAIQQKGYRITPLGQKGGPSFPAVWTMDAKSWVTSPSPNNGPVNAGMVQIMGVAMGGVEDVARVDVSLDGGKNWQKARLTGPDLGKFAWRQFVFATNLKPGTYDVACRVTTLEGKKQVAETTINNGGFLNSGWVAHKVQISVV
jgi:DMSO/TMAO reductase YedYZ molybdopterin-dependent catalytic subunit